MTEKRKKSNVLLSWLGGTILAFCLVTGFVYSASAVDYMLIANYKNYILPFIGAAIVFSFVLSRIFKAEPVLQIREDQHENKVFWLVFISLIAMWSAYNVAFYPGILSIDGYYQLDQGVGLIEMNDHHPVFISWLYGLIFRIGAPVSDRFGVHLLILLQNVLAATAFAAIVREIYSLGFGKWACAGVTAFYGLVPIIPLYVQTVDKTPLYFSVFALMSVYLVQAIRSVKNGKGITHGLMIRLALTGSAACLVRHEGIAILLPALLLLMLMKMSRRDRLRLLIIVLILLIVFGGYKFTVRKVLGLPGSTRQESLSLLYQCTAQYMLCYEKELTAEEYNIIDQVLDAYELPHAFTSVTADPVKNKFRIDCTAEDMNAYIKLMGKLALRHPTCILDTLLHCTYGYYYPFQVIMHDNFYITSSKSGLVDVGLDVDHTHPDGLMKSIGRMMYAWTEQPLLSWILSPATWFWIGLVLFLLLCARRRFDAIIAMVPCMLVWGICLVSPVNGNTRYGMPLMVAVPLMIFWTLANCRKTTNE